MRNRSFTSSTIAIKSIDYVQEDDEPDGYEKDEEEEQF